MKELGRVKCRVCGREGVLVREGSSLYCDHGDRKCYLGERHVVIGEDDVYVVYSDRPLSQEEAAWMVRGARLVAELRELMRLRRRAGFRR